MQIDRWASICATYRHATEAPAAAERLAKTTLTSDEFSALLNDFEVIDNLTLTPGDKAIVLAELAEYAAFRAAVLAVLRTSAIAAAVDESTVTDVAARLNRTRQAVSKEFNRRQAQGTPTRWEDAAHAQLQHQPPKPILGGRR